MTEGMPVTKAGLVVADVAIKLKQSGEDELAERLLDAGSAFLDDIQRLKRERDQARAEGRREGFEAAREPFYEDERDYYYGETNDYAVLEGKLKYASLEHYEREMSKEEHGA